MDPWMMGLLSMFASQNPGQAGPMLDRLGIAPPTPDMLGGPRANEMEVPGPFIPPAAGTQAPTTAPPAPTAESPYLPHNLLKSLFSNMGGGGGGSQPAPLQAPPMPKFPTSFPPEAPPEGNAPVVPPLQTDVNPAPVGLGGPDIWDSLVAQAQANPTGAQPPDPNANAAAQAKALMGLAAMQGIKPPAPVTPIMGGGVAGGVKPPDTAKSLQAGSPAINALMAALLHPGNQDPLRVPTLGSFIRGGKY